MPREAYHKALNELQNELKEIVHNDIAVNRRRFDIEEKCIRLIATQQPMAIDLRTLAAIINIITDLERIGDHAEGIAKINIAIGDEPLVKPLIDIPRMSEKGLEMLDKCMKAFV